MQSQQQTTRHNNNIPQRRWAQQWWDTMTRWRGSGMLLFFSYLFNSTNFIRSTRLCIQEPTTATMALQHQPVITSCLCDELYIPIQHAIRAHEFVPDLQVRSVTARSQPPETSIYASPIHSFTKGIVESHRPLAGAHSWHISSQLQLVLPLAPFLQPFPSLPPPGTK